MQPRRRTWFSPWSMTVRVPLYTTSIHPFNLLYHSDLQPPLLIYQATTSSVFHVLERHHLLTHVWAWQSVGTMLVGTCISMLSTLTIITCVYIFHSHFSLAARMIEVTYLQPNPHRTQTNEHTLVCSPSRQNPLFFRNVAEGNKTFPQMTHNY